MELLDCILCSPPYADQGRGSGTELHPERCEGSDKSISLRDGYGTTEGQIGALREGQPMTSQETREVPVIEWRGCYSDNYRDFIVPIAFSHPAKMAKGLLTRILTYGFEQGFWRAGDTLADCFGGICTTGLVAAYMGLRSISVELEPRFYRMAQGWNCPGVSAHEWVCFQHRWKANPLYPHLCPECQNAPPRYERTGKIPRQEPHTFTGNIDLHRYRLEKLGCPLPVCVQGDSRNFASLAGQCGAILTSPPWAESLDRGRVTKEERIRYAREHGVSNAEHISPIDIEHAQQEGYGHTPGQIGHLRAGDLDGVITSPPYAEGLGTGTHNGIDYAKAKEGGKRATPARAALGEGYGSTPGNLGSLPAGTLEGVDGIVTSPLTAIVTSPPYEGSFNGNQISPEATATAMRGRGCTEEAIAKACTPGSHTASLGYGQTPGNIGNEQSETYWGAVKSVYEQCWLALKPQGVLAVVVKSYVRDKALVDLPGQTATLLSSLGFQVFLRVHALLTETTTEKGLFGEAIVQKRERKSFFRRLCEKKGSPPIDFEVCLFCRKVGGEAGVLAGVVTSPPFADVTQGTDGSFREMRAAWNADPKNAGKPGQRSKQVGDYNYAGAADTYGNHPGNLGNLPPGVPPGDGGEQ